jgi:hypothetical protein
VLKGRLKAREQQEIDRPFALHEYRAAEQALRDRTARLRAERLAREAAGANNQISSNKK